MLRSGLLGAPAVEGRQTAVEELERSVAWQVGARPARGTSGRGVMIVLVGLEEQLYLQPATVRFGQIHSLAAYLAEVRHAARQ